MGREIKFRGWFTGCLDMPAQWVYGSLLIEGDTCTIISYTDKTEGYAVEPESVGQYTGLKDKNGKEIYEGDVVEWWFNDGAVVCEARFSMARFYLSPLDISYGNCHDFIIGGECLYEVIGNIYQNPWLLENQND